MVSDSGPYFCELLARIENVLCYTVIRWLCVSDLGLLINQLLARIKNVLYYAVIRLLCISDSGPYISELLARIENEADRQGVSDVLIPRSKLSIGELVGKGQYLYRAVNLASENWLGKVSHLWFVLLHWFVSTFK